MLPVGGAAAFFDNLPKSFTALKKSDVRQKSIYYLNVFII